MRRAVVLVLCLAVSPAVVAAPSGEAGIHSAEAVTLAAEAGLFSSAIHKQPEFSRFYPRASTVFKPSRPRKEIIQAAMRAANTAIHLDPQLYDAWYVLALCQKTRDIEKYAESLNIFLELSGRENIPQDLKRIVLWEIVHFPAGKMAPGRRGTAVDRALDQLSAMPISDLERLHVSWYRVQNKVDGGKDPAKAFEGMRDAFFESEKFWVFDRDKRLIGYSYAVKMFLEIKDQPGVADREVQNAILPYQMADLPEKKSAVWHHVGHYYERKRMWNDAINAYRKSADFYREATDRGTVVDVYGLDFYGLQSAANVVRILAATRRAREAIAIGEPFLIYPSKEAVAKRADIFRSAGSSEIRYHLASAHEARGNPVRALELYEDASRRMPSRGRINPQTKILTLRRALKVAPSAPFSEVSLDRTGLPALPVTALAMVNGELWAGVFPGADQGIPILLNRSVLEYRIEGGIYSFVRGMGWSRVSIPGVPDGTPVTAMVVTERQLWVATFGAGLGCYDLSARKWDVLNEGTGLPMNHILSLYPDEDRLWIGFGDFQRGGLGWVNLENFSIFVFPSDRRKTADRAGAPAGSVTAIARWDTDLYVAEYLVGLKVFDPTIKNPHFFFVSHYPKPPAMYVQDRRDRISALHVWNDKIWVGFYSAGSSPGLNYAYGGVAQMAGKHAFKLYLREHGLPNNSITALVNFEGSLIASAAGDRPDEGGLAWYDDETDRWTGMDGFRALSMYAAPAVLYVGTSNGVKAYERR